MFNCLNIFNYKKKNQTKNNDDTKVQININKLDKKKFNLENIIGNFYVESVYDGDTITIIIPVKSHIYNMISQDHIDDKSDNNKSNIVYFNSIKIRLLGIDTPEIKPSKDLPNRDEHIIKAKEAKEFLSSNILGKVIRVELLYNDKYGRPLAKIYNDNICLNDLMVEKGYAKNYNGGTKDINL